MESQNLTLDLRSYCSEVQAHQHDYHQLVFSVAGRIDMRVEQNEGGVSQQHGAVIPAGCDHGFSSDSKNCFLVADVPIALAPELKALPAFIPVDDTLAHYIVFLHQTLVKGGASGNSQRQMLVLLIQLLRERFGGVIHLDHRIEAARAHLDHYFAKSLPLAELAGVASLSTRQLSQLFRQQLGMTPMQYQTEKRMQQAWQMLELGANSVEQVSNSVGYGSLSAFSDRFRKHFGQSPRSIRQNDKEVCQIAKDSR